ncbi:MAG: response regulator [Rhodocyclaceae bacterium]|nr:response regulator [Rhodocyclaceae bacterium]
MSDSWRLDGDNASILIVDDEPANLKLLDRMLAMSKYRDLRLLSDPRQVLPEYLSRRPHLILLDLNMPHLDGFAVMEQLGALGDPLLPPIIVLTAQVAREYKLRALTSGARDYLTKPFDLAELQARVRNLLDAHQAHLFMHDQQSALEALVDRRTAELRETRLQVVRRLGRAAEYRDNETGNHIARMSIVSRMLAAALGWSEAACALMLEASPMHDVGKIGIPDRILQKPGRLTPEEFEVIKTHPAIGAELLSGDDSDLLVMASEIALSHHEKWDGSGYPRGLAGEAIPLSGRIVAVADVFDALTSTRPYKRPWSFEDACALIRDGRGKHFDPAVVDRFLEQFDAIVELTQGMRDEDHAIMNPEEG